MYKGNEKNVVKPEFSASLSPGHFFEDMYKGKEKNVVAVVDGLMASLHIAVASTIMNLLKGSGAPPQLHMFEYLSKMMTTEEILCKPAMKESKCECLPSSRNGKPCKTQALTEILKI